MTGTMFLLSGLTVMIFATLGTGMDDPTGGLPTDPSIWVSLANAVMGFIIELLEVEWTPIRVGVFLIIIGFIMDGSGAYLMVSSETQAKKSTRSRSSSKNRRK